jgi:hypothetical protein
MREQQKKAAAACTLPLIFHSLAASSFKKDTKPNDNDIIANVPDSLSCLEATNELFPRVAL